MVNKTLYNVTEILRLADEAIDASEAYERERFVGVFGPEYDQECKENRLREAKNKAVKAYRDARATITGQEGAWNEKAAEVSDS